MEQRHGVALIAGVYDYLERFNFIKEKLKIGWEKFGDFYDLNLQEMEMLVCQAHFGHGLISSGVGNQDYFIDDFDYDTMKETLFSLVDKGLFEIDTKNVDGDTFYYSYLLTEEGEALFEDLIDKYDILLEDYGRDKDQLQENYDNVIESLNYLLDDLSIVSDRKNIDAINEAQAMAIQELIDEMDEEEEAYQEDDFNHKVISVFNTMIVDYQQRLAEDYEDVKMGYLEAVEDNNIIVHALVYENGDYVEKKFLFKGNDTRNYVELSE